MRVALFKNASSIYSYESAVMETSVDKNGIYLPEYVRVSEWAEVDFKPLADEVVVQAQLKALDTVESELRMKFQDKLSQIDGERQKLLAIGHEVSA